jgi:nicotinamidase-related amidase
MLDSTTLTLILADLQHPIITRSKTNDHAHLLRTADALAQTSAAFNLPTIISAVPLAASDKPEDLQIIKEITEPLPKAPILVRRSPHLMEHTPTRDAIAATGRRTLAICGVATEVVVIHAARQLGYEVHVIVDACAGFSPRTEDAAFAEIARAGAHTTPFVTFATAMISDFTTPSGQAIRKLFHSLMN